MKISLPHTLAALFGAKNSAALSSTEQESLKVIQQIIANRIKWSSYPNVAECPDHFRIYCIKKSFNPVTQLQEEMRLFVLMHMQSEMAVVVSYDAVRGNQHSWSHHKKKITEALALMKSCGLTLSDEIFNRIAEPEGVSVAQPADNNTTIMKARLDAVATWLTDIASESIISKKQIVQAFQYLIELIEHFETTSQAASLAKKVTAVIVKAFQNKQQTISLSPLQDHCQIAIISPNHEFYRPLSLPTKQMAHFMKTLIELLEPQFLSDEPKRLFFQFLANSLAMAPRTILDKLLASKCGDLFDEATIVNTVLEASIVAYHQSKLTITQMIALLQLLKKHDCVAFIEYPLISPLMKILQAEAKLSSASSNPTSSTSTSSSSASVLASLACDGSTINLLYQKFCLTLCPKFLKEEFQLFCDETNPLREFKLLKIMLMQCGDTPLTIKLGALLPWCDRLLATPEQRQNGLLIMQSLLIEYAQLPENEQEICREYFTAYAEVRKSSPFVKDTIATPEPVSMASSTTVTAKAKSKASSSRAITHNIPVLTVEKYNDHFTQWRKQCLKKRELFSRALDSGVQLFYPLMDEFYHELQQYNLQNLSQNVVLYARLTETLLFEQNEQTPFITAAIAGHLEFFTFILKLFPAELVVKNGYTAMIFIANYGNSPKHLDCFARGLKLNFNLNPDFINDRYSILARTLWWRYGSRIEGPTLHFLKAIINLLIDAGADINYPCYPNGLHALQFAITVAAPIPLIELLLKRGALVTYVVPVATANGIEKISALDLALGLARDSRVNETYANAVIKIVKRAGGKLQFGACRYNLGWSTQLNVGEQGQLDNYTIREIPQFSVVAYAIEQFIEKSEGNFTQLNQLLKKHVDYYVEPNLFIRTLRAGREDLALFILQNLPCGATCPIKYASLGLIATPLYWAIYSFSNLVLALLLDDDANPNDLYFKFALSPSVPPLVQTAVHAAIDVANPDGLALLLRYGASLDEKVYLSPKNFCPYFENDVKKVSLDLPYTTIPIIMYAAAKENYELTLKLLEYQDTKVFTVDDTCRFRQAALRGDLVTLKKLALQVNVNAAPEHGMRNTALHNAYLKNQQGIIRYLIDECHADQNRLNAEGKKPHELAQHVTPQMPQRSELVGTPQNN